MLLNPTKENIKIFSQKSQEFNERTTFHHKSKTLLNQITIELRIM